MTMITPTPTLAEIASTRELLAGLAELEADTHLHGHKENIHLFPRCGATMCIPTDLAMLTPGLHRDFLAERGRLIAGRLNAFLMP